MTTVLLSTALFLGGAMLTASQRPAVRTCGVLSAVLGLLLWFGLSLVCGPGPLMHCAIVQ